MEGKRYEAEPRLRFNNYNTVWEQHKLKDFFEKYQNTIYVKDDEEYRQVTVSNNGTVKYRATTSGSKIGRKRQYAIDTDTHPLTLTFTRQNVFDGGIGFVPKELNGSIVTENMPLLAMHDADANFMTALFKTESYLHGVINENKPTGSAQKALHEKVWLEGNVTVPSLEEQTKIGNYFSQLDNAITLHQRKCDELKELKKYMLQNMFPKKGSNNPIIRFEGFTDAWEQRKCGDFATESSEKGHNGADAKKLTVKLHTKGIYEADEKTQGSDNTQYYVRHAGQFIYGKQNFFNGAIGVVPENLEKYESTKDVPAFDIDESVNVEWFYQYMARPEIYKPQELNCTGTGSKRFHVNNFLDMDIPTPSYEEQTKIGNYFSQLDHAITLHQRKFDELKELKKYMLQNMFPKGRA